ncbi:MAG: hypothetical protein CYPHOPRED_001576 [Cyphobasidiales sp. Tagirdzhanova-0007]|nr:MAG: hypothetical protein CYPHOPRED_001576 [Cyphobasidiales sp. Tagirdzhanova-0007]
MASRRMRPIALGAIMILVPAGFYLGTALSTRKQVAVPSHVPAPSSTFALPAELAAEHIDHGPSSQANDIAILQGRVKSLKHTKSTLEKEVRDNEAKLRKIEERITRQNNGLASSAA